MSVLDLKNCAQGDKHVSAPICVIGAGLAGLTLAMRLAEAGQKVIVLESGSESLDTAAHELRPPHTISGRNARAMCEDYGAAIGRSGPWRGRMRPLSPFETGRRDHVGLSGWPLPVEELTCHYHQIEKLFGIKAEASDARARADLDPEHVLPRVDPDFEAHWTQWPSAQQCSLANLHGKQVGANPNVELWLSATVKRFDIDPETGRLRSILACNAFGKRLTVRADQFVLAAGTIETTRLLLWLDAAAGRRVFARSQALGAYLQSHIIVRVARVLQNDGVIARRLCASNAPHSRRTSLHFELTQAAQQNAGSASAFAYISTKPEQTAWQVASTRSTQSMFASRVLPRLARATWAKLLGQGHAKSDSYVEICAEQIPDDRNSIELCQDRDALGVPKGRLHWRPMLADEHTLRSATDRLAAYWSRHELDRHIPLEWLDVCRNPEGQISSAAVDYAHPSGTVRMGTNRNSSVVGPDLACHEIPNLSVVSAAVFPSAGSANPTLTLLALAMRHADSLIAKRSRSSAARFSSKVGIAATSSVPAALS